MNVILNTQLFCTNEYHGLRCNNSSKNTRVMKEVIVIGNVWKTKILCLGNKRNCYCYIHQGFTTIQTSCPVDWAEFSGECFYFGNVHRSWLDAEV